MLDIYLTHLLDLLLFKGSLVSLVPFLLVSCFSTSEQALSQVARVRVLRLPPGQQQLEGEEGGGVLQPHLNEGLLTPLTPLQIDQIKEEFVCEREILTETVWRNPHGDEI